MEKYILPHHLKGKPDIPSDWNMSDFEIEDRIKELRKEIYQLQNSRKKQPCLVVIEDNNDDWKIKILKGWKILDLEKGFFEADHWTYPCQSEAKELLETFNFTDKVKDILRPIAEGDRK